VIRSAAVLALLVWGGAGRLDSQTDSLRPSVALTGIQGFATPTYERVSGLAVPVGFDVVVPTLSFRATPLLSYRSQLGAIDPSVRAKVNPSDRTEIVASVAHGLYTNDGWIRNDLINSFEFLAFGQDARNYSRGTRGELRLSHDFGGGGWTTTPEIGVRLERLESVRAEPVLLGGPFTFLGQNDSLGRLRPTVPVQGGAIQSALAGVRLGWDSAAIKTRLRIDVELAHQSSTADGTPVFDPYFAQITLDGDVSFATFGRQSLHVYAHAVTTSGGDTPRQRWAYLGGPGTLATIDLLSLGGDRLLYVDAHYSVPIRRWSIPFVGPPLIELREALGGAAFRASPTLEQLSGVRVAASYVYAEWLVDPVRRRSLVSAGLSLFQ
jgi:hypothetical protein